MDKIEFSANTGFLWKEEPFLDRIRNAKNTGFECLEFHDEAQKTDIDELTKVLTDEQISSCGMNTNMGDTLGRAAIP